MIKLKSNKGVTLTMLVIYIIILTLAIGILAMISNYFYANTKYITDSGKYISEFNKFNMYFIEDVKNNSNIYSIKTNEIIFNDGTVYTYKATLDNSIYRNNVKICKNVQFCEFSKTENASDDSKKIIISVRMVLNQSKLFETSTDYVLRYW